MFDTTFLCESITPLGCDVVPAVKAIIAVSYATMSFRTDAFYGTSLATLTATE